MKISSYTVKRIAIALSVTLVTLFVIPAAEAEGKTIAREKYMNDKDITELVIGGDVTSIGDRAYYGCTNLRSVILSEGVKSIGESAFAMCPNLSYVAIPSTVKNIEPGVFAGDTSLSYLEFPRGNYNFYYVAGALYDPKGTRLISYMPGKEYSFYDMPDSVKYVDNYAFWGSNNLKKVYVSPRVESITPYDFAYCSQLEYVYLPESVERIEQCAFRDCKNLKYIYAEEKKIAVDDTAFMNANKVQTVSGTDLAAFNSDCVVPGEDEEAEKMKLEAATHQDGNKTPPVAANNGDAGSAFENVSDIERGRQVAANSHITSNTHPGNNFGVVDSKSTGTSNGTTTDNVNNSSASSSGTLGSGSTTSSSNSGSGSSSSSSSGTGGSSSSSISSSSSNGSTSGNSVSGNSSSSSSSNTGGTGGPTRIINYNYYDTTPTLSEQLAEYRRKLTQKLSGPYKGGYYGSTYTGGGGIKVNLPNDW